MKCKVTNLRTNRACQFMLLNYKDGWLVAHRPDPESKFGLSHFGCYFGGFRLLDRWVYLSIVNWESRFGFWIWMFLFGKGIKFYCSSLSFIYNLQIYNFLWTDGIWFCQKLNNMWNESLLVDNKVSKNKSIRYIEGDEQS